MNIESPQPAAQESREKPKKFLAIDDEPGMIYIFGAVFGKNENMTAVECHSLEDARAAIESNQPDIIFLDHNFGKEGGEGMIIARELIAKHPEIKIYSTTTDPGAEAEYANLKIGHVNKSLPREISSIVSKERA